MTRAAAVPGDILHVAADAMVMTVDSAGKWRGQLDAAFMKSTASAYAGELQSHMPLRDGDVIVVENPGYFAPAFDRIIFVVDELVRPLSSLIGFGLTEAEKLRLRKVTLPPLRIDTSHRLKHEDPLEQISRAIINFNRRGGKYVQEIKVVVHNDYPTCSRLNWLLEKNQVSS